MYLTVLFDFSVYNFMSAKHYSFAEKSSSASEVPSKTKRKKCSFISRCLKVTGFIILFPIVLFTTVSVLSMINPSFGLYMGQKTADLQYPLQRVVRLISLPLHRYIDLSKWSNWECMVDNPLYVPGRMLLNCLLLLLVVDSLIKCTICICNHMGPRAIKY